MLRYFHGFPSNCSSTSESKKKLSEVPYQYDCTQDLRFERTVLIISRVNIKQCISQTQDREIDNMLRLKCGRSKDDLIRFDKTRPVSATLVTTAVSSCLFLQSFWIGDDCSSFTPSYS